MQRMAMVCVVLAFLVVTVAHGRRMVFSINDTATILLDHQTGLIDFANTTGPAAIVTRNVVTLTKIIKAFNMPLILVTALETEMQGPTIPALQQAAPQEWANRVRRMGIINSWEQPEFVQAVKATGRRNLLMAGITTEIGVVAPALAAAEAGYNVKVISDAGGSESMLIEQIAWQRLQDGGVEVITVGAIVAELVKDSSGPNGIAYNFFS